MKNFGTLYRYELKKLLWKKLSWIMVLLISVFSIYLIVQDSQRDSWAIESVDDNGKVIQIVMSDKDVKIASRDAARELNGQIIDDTFLDKMFQSLSSLSDVPLMELHNHLVFEYSIYWHAYSLVDSLFWDPFSEAAASGTITAEQFYAAQEEAMKAWVYYENLPEGEQTYWMKQMSHVQVPMVYQRPWIGYANLFDFCERLISFIPALAGICLCRLFSSERRTRVEALLFSSKESRLPLYLAKVSAGLTTALLAAVLVIGVVMTTFLVIWGGEGLNATVQMIYTSYPSPTTIGHVIWKMMVWVVIYALLCGAFTMLLSLLTRSAAVAFLLPVVLFGFISRYRFSFSWCDDYLPYSIAGWSSLLNTHLVRIFGLYLNHFQSGPLLYLAISVLLMALCWLGWRQRAVGKI